MENHPEMAAILHLIASCRPWFHMMSSMSGLLPAIKGMIDNKEARGKQTDSSAMGEDWAQTPL